MADNGSFKRVLATVLQQLSTVDGVRFGQYASFAIQEMAHLLLLDGSLAAENGFFANGFKVSAIPASFDVKIGGGWGFKHDATGLLIDESPYRLLLLLSDLTLSTGGAPPGAGTYYVHCKWQSADGQSENRLVRPAPGDPFGVSAVDTAHMPDPDVIWSANPAEAGYTRIATVVVPGAPVDSQDYTYTDERQSLSIVERVVNIPFLNAVPIEAVPGDAVPYGGGSYGWQVIAGGDVEFYLDVPKVDARDVPQKITKARVWVKIINAADDAVLTVYKQPAGSGIRTPMGTATVAGISDGWLEATVVDASADDDAVFLHIQAPTGIGATIAAIDLEQVQVFMNRRYMGP